MSTYAEHFAKHVRIALLRLLADAPQCRANSSILASALAGLGLSTSRDKVRVELAWLEEQGLVTVQDLVGLVVATATERGLDVATGIVTVPGVQRPTPRG